MLPALALSPHEKMKEKYAMFTKRPLRYSGRWLPPCLVLLAVGALANPAASANSAGSASPAASASPTASAKPIDLATRFRINDENPSANVPSAEDANANPLEFGYMIQDLVARGEGAIQKKEWDRAVKYYEALAQAVPDRAITYRKLCSGYAELGKIDIAAANCGKAITLGGARVFDHFRFVNLSLRKAKLSTADVADLEASIAHVRAHIALNPPPVKKAEPAPTPSSKSAKPSKDPIKTKEQVKDEFLARRAARARGLEVLENKEEEAQQTVSLPLEIELLACKLSVRLRDERKLDACIDGLKRVKADEKVVISFEWARAIVRKDSVRAGELLESAKSLGVLPAALQAMTDEQRRTFADTGILGFFKRRGIVVVLAVFAAALATFGALRFARSRKLGATPEAQPQ
jgi:hypothetical protein